MKNQKIRQHAKRCGVKLWEIADALGIPDNAFSRKLRHELPDAEQNRIVCIIDKLEEEKNHARACEC